MKHQILVALLIGILVFSCSNKQADINATSAQQNKPMDNFEYSLKSAHPQARALMTDEFYWSPIEETAPFGSDDGSDAAYGFRLWRLENKTASPLRYLKDLIASWQYPYFDYHELDTTIIKAYITKKANLDEATIQQQIQTLKEINKNSPDTSMKLDDDQLREVIISSSNNMGGIYLVGQDNAIIGTGFAQFVLEGHIDDDFRSLVITAIRRQLLPLLIDRYDEHYRDRRKLQLTRMLEVVNKINS